MSVSAKGRVPPKTGSFPPVSGAEADGEAEYAALVAAALRSELGQTHQATKTVMRWTGAGERTVKAWLAGESGPGGARLIALMRHSEAVFRAVLVSAGRPLMLATANLAVVHKALVETARLIETASEDEQRRQRQLKPGTNGPKWT